ncbi:MAG: ROK family protein [Pirellulales bacterium]
MFLGIEIGGTKLQLGVGRGDGTLVALARYDVRPKGGAEGILAQIEAAARVLIARHGISAVGIGFGGPVDSTSGVVVKSHHVAGWDDFPLVDWCRRVLMLPAVLENDCDAAGLAEARHGAGRGRNVVFYVTVGTGIGGGLVVGGEIFRASGHGAAEIGHLRPGLHADRPDQTVESLASGWGIAAAAQDRLSDPISHAFVPLTSGLRGTKPDDVRQRLIETEEAEAEYAADLLDRCDGKLDQLTAQMVSQAAGEGNEIAREVLSRACQALGWAIAQTITLVAPEAIVIGGGVPSMDESLFLVPLRLAVDRYVFPPFVGTFQILPAELGEQVVVHGAIAAAAEKRTVDTLP